MSLDILKQRQDEIIEDFEELDDWLDKYQQIIDYAKDLPKIDDSFKTEEYLIKGCQSQVWVNATCDTEGIIHFTADSDAVITKGIIAMLIDVLSGLPAETVANNEIYFIDKIGLKDHLSGNRANGLVSMMNYLKKSAQNACKA